MLHGKVYVCICRFQFFCYKIITIAENIIWRKHGLFSRQKLNRLKHFLLTYLMFRLRGHTRAINRYIPFGIFVLLWSTQNSKCDNLGDVKKYWCANAWYTLCEKSYKTYLQLFTRIYKYLQNILEVTDGKNSVHQEKECFNTLIIGIKPVHQEKIFFG